MIKVGLKKLLTKKEVFSLINEITGNAGASVNILDADGILLTGTENKEFQNKHPIHLADETIGWVMGDDKASSVASLLSYLAGAEFEKKALASETLDKYKEITLLYNFAEKIAGCLNLKEVIQLIIEEARKIIKSNNISVLLMNKETRLLEVTACWGSEYKPNTTINPKEGLAGNVLLSGKAEIINNVSEDPRYIAGSSKISSTMYSPLKTKKGIIGLMNIGSEESITYTAGDLKLFIALSSQAAIAIENARLHDNLRDTFITTIQTLAEAIEKRDPNTSGHAKRVMNYSVAIGKTLGLSNEYITRLKLSAIFHDIGMIGIRDSILLKAGLLTDDEFDEQKKHPLYGEEILKFIKQLKDIIPGVKQHHERYDGRGYPKGLKGDEIDIVARIIAVADSFDIMTSDKPYKKKIPHSAAITELRRNAGTQFDPAVVKAFLTSYNEIPTGE